MNYLKDIVSENIDYILCRPDKKEIKVMKDIIFNYKYLFSEVGELSFEIPYVVEDKTTHKSTKNELIDLIKDKYLICRFNKDRNKKEYYKIIERVENKDYKGNKKTLKIQSRLLECNLGDINFPTIKGTFQLYRDPNDTVHTGDGIINVIPMVSNWKIGYVSQKAKDSFIENIEVANPALITNRNSKTIHPIMGYNYNGNGTISENNFATMYSKDGKIQSPILDQIKITSKFISQERKYRIFDINDKKIREVIREELEPAFDVKFFFDTDKEEINIFSNDEISEEVYLHLSDRKYLTELNQKTDSRNVITRLYVYGRDGCSIAKFNLFGTDYVEDFSFYRNEKYMDKEFLDAFDKYDALLIEKQIEFKKLLEEKIGLRKVESDIKTQLNSLRTDLEIAKNELNGQLLKGGDVNYYTLKVKEAERRIQEKENELQNIKNQISDVDIIIAENAEAIKKENNFTKEQMDTINRVFLKEDVWTNENYYEEIADKLYEAGKEELKKKANPPTEISIESVDILSNEKFRVDAEKIKIGNILNIIVPDDKIDIKLKIIEISGSDNKDKNDFKITVSNKNEVINANRSLSRVWGTMRNQTNTVLHSKYKWDVSETTSKTVNELINDDLDTAKKTIYFNNQSSKIDNYGIEMCNSENTDERLKLTSGAIIMTEDNWKTVGIAMTPKGIIAEKLIGRILIGEGLILQNKTGSVKFNENGLRIRSDAFIVEGGIPDEMIPSAKNWNKIEGNMKNYIDLQTEDLNKGLTSLNNAVDMFSSDEFITVSESKTLEQELIKVKAESAQFIQFARDLSITTELDNYIKAIDGLELELRQWVGLPSYPVKILEVNRLKVTKLFEAVESTKSILTNKISNTLATNAENKAKEYSDKQIEQVNTSLNGLNDDINKFSDDGFITKDEASNLKNQLLQVKAESQDFINLGTSLGVATYVANYSNALTTLETLLNNYIDKTNYPLTIDLIARHSIFDSFENVQKYKSELINKINQKIGDNALEGSKTYTNSQFKVLDKEISSRVKTVDFDNTVSSINERVEVAEQKMTDNNINLKVSYDNLHKQTRLTETFDIAVIRNQPAINPLMSLNYNGGGVFANNTLINAVNENREVNKLADIEIQDNKIYQFTDGMSEAIDKANSEIDMLKNDITLKVSKETFNNTVSELNDNINNAKNYVDGQISEVNNSMQTLQTSINNVGKDLKLTAVEANTLKIDLERVTSESIDIINVASALNITTEKTNYSSALTILTNYLNTNWLNKVYPLNITQTQIDNITNYFKDLENKKSILINKISAIREQNAKSYIDTQKQELNKSINGLNTTINSAFSDNSLTNIEAQSLKIAYQNVIKEADDVIAIANSLSISTTNIVTAKSNLTTEINKWINKTSYPLPITTTNRTNMNNAFINLQSAIVQLNKAIEDKKVGRAETNARTYTEAQIKILNESINLKVSKDYVDSSISGKANKDTLISEINMSPESIKLKADKIDITGLVTISSLKQAGTVAINGSNVKIGGSGGDGVLTTKDAYDNEIVKIDKEGICVTVFPDTGRPEEGGIPQPFRINFSNGVDLLKIGADNYIEFHGAINVTTGTDYVSMSPWGFSFSNGAHINASKYRGLVDINDVAIGNGTELNHMQNINYRLGLSGVKIHNGQSDGGYGPIYGSTKNAITLTPTYGELVTFADESPNHVQHDSGYGIIGNDGYCIIHLDLKYMETTTTKQGDYLVYLTSYVGCNAELVSTHREYFIVKGNVGKRFNWFTRCEVRGMERLRWNEADVYN